MPTAAKKQTTSARSSRSKRKSKAAPVEFKVGDRVVSTHPNDLGVCTVVEIMDDALCVVPDSGDNKRIWVEARYWQIDSDRVQLVSEEAIAAADQRLRDSGGAIVPMGDAVPAIAEIVDADEPTARFAELRRQVRANLAKAEEASRVAWIALHEIRSKHLWKLGRSPDGMQRFQSFEEFCMSEYGWERSNSHAVAASGAVVSDLQSRGLHTELLPSSVDQARKLSRVEPDDRPIVLQQAAELNGGKLSAAAIERAVAQYQGDADQARFEAIVAKYAELPHTQVVRTQNGSFHYAVEHSGGLSKTKVYRSVKELEDAFDYHKEWVERRLKEMAARSANGAVELPNATVVQAPTADTSTAAAQPRSKGEINLELPSADDSQSQETIAVDSTPVQSEERSAIESWTEAAQDPDLEPTKTVRDVPGYGYFMTAIAGFVNANKLDWSASEKLSIADEVMQLLCDRAGLEVVE